MNLKRNRNAAIDCFRMLSSFSVVALHSILLTAMFLGWDYSAQYRNFVFVVLEVGRFGVPIFLITSGYYLYSQKSSLIEKASSMKAKALRNAKKIATLYISSLVFIVFALFFLNVEHDFRRIPSLFLVTPANFPYLFVRADGSDYSIAVTPLWYLFGVIIVYLICYFMIKLFRNKYEAAFAMILIISYMASLLQDYKPEFLDGNTFWIISRSMLMFFVGYFIAKFQDQLISIPKKVLITIIIAVFFTATVDLLTNAKLDSITILATTPLITGAIFVFLLRFPNFLVKTPIPQWASRYCVYIYIIHMLIIELYMRHSSLNVVTLIFATFFTSLTLAVVYFNIKKLVISKFTTKVIPPPPPPPLSS
jgi:surface polysaccharide O-acyltransferase-like enzyme